MIIKVAASESGKRLDIFLQEQLEGKTRSQIKRLIEEQLVFVGDKLVTKAGLKVQTGMVVSLTVPEPRSLNVVAEPIALNIIFEDSDLIVINKPQGMVVHPAPGHDRGTLVNALLSHCDDLSGINGVLRPGVVHRLDKDTSGALVVAKNDFTHVALAAQLKQRTVKRRYLAVTQGIFNNLRGTIDAPIGRHPLNRKKMAVTDRNARQAITHYRVVDRVSRYSLIDIELDTGRTHQIRVHMEYIGHPIVGDPMYGRRDPQALAEQCSMVGQALHAYALGFIHPRTHEPLTFHAPLPDRLESLLQHVGLKCEKHMINY